MQPVPLHRYTFQEYLELEEVSRVRHEFLAGEIYAMAGGTPEHAAISAHITALLGPQLEQCKIYSSDLRVRVLATGLATYPDVTLICGRSERDPESPTHVTNPTLIVEVKSRSTEEYDRGEKLEHYKQVPSLKTILLVNHRLPELEMWEREGSRWHSRKFGPGEVVRLTAVDASLSVDEVYAAAHDV